MFTIPLEDPAWHCTETLCLVKDIRGGTDRQGRKFILQRVWCWPEVVEGTTVPKAEGLGRVSCSVTTLLRKCGKTASRLS